MSKLTVSLFLVSTVATAVASPPPPPIVGGQTAKPGAWPDVVAVLAPDGACTGTLIAPDVVLTAGHCTTEITPSVVVIDTIDYGKPGGEIIAVKSVVGYPNWEHAYDVGVVMLAHAAKAKPRPIARACEAKTVEVVGFGLTTTAGTGDNTRLHQASLPVVDTRCTEAPGCNAAIAPDTEFAAGGQGTDSCFGDSGGPAFAQTPSGLALFGVVSRGLSEPGRPCGNGGIYVRADAKKVLAWIEKTTGRKVARASCGKSDGEDAAADETNGCNAGGAELGLVALLPGLVWRRRKKKLS